MSSLMLTASVIWRLVLVCGQVILELANVPGLDMIVVGDVNSVFINHTL